MGRISGEPVVRLAAWGARWLRPREAQRYPERPREAQRASERPRPKGGQFFGPFVAIYIHIHTHIGPFKKRLPKM